MRIAEVFGELGAWLQRLGESTGISRSAVAAGAVLLIGWIVAQLLRLVVRKIIVRLERLLPSRGQAAVEDVVGQHRAASLISRAVFWIVLLIFVMTATEMLGLPVVTAWLSGITAYLPRLLLALVVAMLGVVVGRVTRRTVSRAASTAGFAYAARMGRLAQAAVVIATLLVAVEQLGIQIQFVTNALMIAFGALLGGAALAFGLGGRSVVANILAGHYVRKLYDVGQVIRVGGIEGRILRMTPIAIILDAEEGEVLIPSGELITVRSTLVARGGR